MKPIKSTLPSMEKVNNLNDLQFFMNSVSSLPLFNDLRALIKYLAILYGAAPNEMTTAIQ